MSVDKLIQIIVIIIIYTLKSNKNKFKWTTIQDFQVVCFSLYNFDI